MTIQSKESNFKIDAEDERPNLEQSKSARPNIDHLIKRIITERRNESRKNLYILIFILLVITGFVIFTF
jgi:hypothetical protein|tara:strand:- start:220 stop:426 length:207 start_codon:yes stop_codon:yes gene_type:complete